MTDKWSEPIPEQVGELTYWKPEAKGDSIEGIYRGQHPHIKDVATFGMVPAIMVNGKPLDLPSHADLRNKLATVPVGREVRIEYAGKSGKAERYIVQVSQTAPLEQTRIAQGVVIDSSGKLISCLRQAPAGLEDAPFWDMVSKLNIGTMSDMIKTVEKLKAEGRLLNDHGVWVVT